MRTRTVSASARDWSAAWLAPATLTRDLAGAGGDLLHAARNLAGR